MQVWLTPRQRAKRLEAYKLRRNPTPNRSSTDRSRIISALKKISSVIEHWLQTTEYRYMQWLPHKHVITAQDDDRMRDFYADYSEDLAIDETGYMKQFHDPGIKATNKIVAVTYYVNATGGEFLLAKGVFSPLPCNTWGRLPLTLSQWKLIAGALVVMHQLWQWVHAVRDYTNDDSFEVGGFMGWHLTETVKASNLADMKNSGNLVDARSEDDQAKDADGWIGHTIYKHIIDVFSLQDSTGHNGKCRR